MSDGLGGHVGLSCSPGLGSAKRVTKNKTHILLFNILLVFLCKSYSFQVEELSLVLDFQRSNELYKLIKFPHARRIHISMCTIFYQYMFLILFISNLVLWRFIFLLLCGDIELILVQTLSKTAILLVRPFLRLLSKHSQITCAFFT